MRQSFPESVLGSFTVAAEDAIGPDAGTVLVDATDFFTSRRAQRGRCAGKTGLLQTGYGSISDRHRRHQGISQEHRG